MQTFVSIAFGRAARLTAALVAVVVACAAQTPTLTTLYSFNGGPTDGANPSAGLVFGGNGSLFGATPYGGAAGLGTLFELTPGTPWTEQLLYSFQGGSDGAYPAGPLLLGTGGVFYGATFAGGSTGNGTVFELTPPKKKGGAWKETVIYTFQGIATGAVNVAGTVVTLASGTPFVTGTTWNGVTFYINGTAYTIASVSSSSSLTLTATAGNLTAAAYTVNSAPPGPWAGWSDASGPEGGMIILQNGKIYGAAIGGGSAGAGAVFQLTPPVGSGPWVEKVIYSFQDGKDGSGPESGVILSNGSLFGNTCCGTVGGTVFELKPNKSNWTKSSVFNFSTYAKGKQPVGGMASDSNGVLYGTTKEGGTDGAGIIFSLTPGAAGKPYTLTTIHTFTNGSDGGAPYGTVLLGSSGQVYATVSSGCDYGVGGVLEFTPPAAQGADWTETVLYSFTGAQDGSQPTAGVITNSTGALFGTTPFSNYGLGYGTVYQLTQ